MDATPTQEFEHVLIASDRCSSRTVDLVWLVAGIEWLRVPRINDMG